VLDGFEPFDRPLLIEAEHQGIAKQAKDSTENESPFRERAFAAVPKAQIDPTGAARMEGLNYFCMERRGHFRMTVLKQTLMRYPWVPAPSFVLTGEDKFGEVRGQSGDLNSGRVDGQRREDKWLASLQRLDDRIPCNLVERTEHWFEIGQAKDRLTASGGSRHVRTPLAELFGTKRSRCRPRLHPQHHQGAS
jgi:hypothetical protein